MRQHCQKSCHDIDERIGNLWYKPKPYSDTQYSPTCQLYMAESSIPNSGLGMYTAAPIPRGKIVYHPDIIVNYFDFQANNEIANEITKSKNPIYARIVRNKINEHSLCTFWAKEDECRINPEYMLHSCAKACALWKAGLNDEEEERNESYWLPDDYYWNAEHTESCYEAEEVSSLVPGLGALANSHTGLFNVNMLRARNDNLAYHRSSDPGVGAFSSFHNLAYKVAKNIPAGMELFVEYGDEWFSGREEKFGPLPLSYHFQEADGIVKKFWKTVKDDDLPFAEDLYNLTRNLVTDIKLRMALPETLEKAKEARTSGTAMLTVPNVIRSSEWLDKNGICLDNIRSGQSEIDQAGRGAIATRKIEKGSIIAPLPLIHMDRRKLRMFEDFDNEDDPNELSEQLILNYSYGHRDSTLLLFPYSPIVNFLNNNSDKMKVNARIRWSSSKYNAKEWEKLTADEVLSKKRAGLMLEVVAIRDIEMGDEIYIDYGAEWDAAWELHKKTWKPPSPGYIPIHQLNMEEVVRTEEETKSSPYSDNAMILCFVHNSIDEAVKEDEQEIEWSEYQVTPSSLRNSRPCNIINRHESVGEIRNETKTVYDAKLQTEDNVPFILRGIPRRAIEFVNRQYTSDQHLLRPFRHPIHIPDEIFPEKWKNLASSSFDDGQTYVHTSVKESWENVEGASQYCRYFLAESSIEGAGLGLYAGVSLKPGDFTKKEVIVPVYDYEIQTQLRCAKDPFMCHQNSEWLLGHYEWHPSTARANHDAAENYMAIPGMGSIPNHHSGLASAQPQIPMKSGGDLHRSRDPAAGAISLFDGMQFQITRPLQEGQEIFISYGSQYFQGHQEYQNITTLSEFLQADKIVDSFFKRFDQQLENDTKVLQDEWNFERAEFVPETLLGLLPTEIDALIQLRSMGTALFNVPNALRSREWLQENGRCLDNIAVKKSTVQSAGRGAIATRSIKKGEIITTSPVLQHNRQYMTMYMHEGGANESQIVEKTKQLIFNYMYGHKNSNLMLWPIAPAVNAINHITGDKVNAKIQWSSFPHHKAEWLNKTTSEVLGIFKSGLILDYVATKDILVGEEIFIDYGPDFDKAWNDYVRIWTPEQDAQEYRSSWHFISNEEFIRTRQEEPYPENIRVYCSIPQEGWFKKAERVKTPFGVALVWIKNDSDMHLTSFESSKPCEILERWWDDEANDYLYSVLVRDPEHGDFLMTEVQYIFLVDAKYTIDHFLRNVFRHEIHVPEGLYPEKWLDLGL